MPIVEPNIKLLQKVEELIQPEKQNEVLKNRVDELQKKWNYN